MPEAPEPSNNQDKMTDLVPIEPEMSMLTPENVQKLGIVSQARFSAGKLVDNKWYARTQRVATYTSVLAEFGYRSVCGMADIQADEQIADILRMGPLPLFAANFGLKLGARGLSHLKTPEGWMDPISIAAEGITGLNVGNVRLAKLLKGMKGARQVNKFMRTAQVAMGKASLEDKSMGQISEYITWYTMGLLASIPLVADFKELNYSDPVDIAKELGFNVGIIGGAKLLNHGIRGVIHENYTKELNQVREEVKRILDENPELNHLRKEFEYFDDGAADKIAAELGLSSGAPVKNLVERMQEAEQSAIHPSLVWEKWAKKHGITAKYEDYAVKIGQVSKNEMLVIVAGMLKSMVSNKELINPVGEDMALDENGNIMTKEIDAVVMVTDLRNFTPLTASKKIQGNIFAFLKLNYFSYLKHVIKEHGGKILNHTGDGLVIYFKDQEGENTKEQNAIACAHEINKITNLMDKVWHEEGVVNPEDCHQTGIGLAWGTIRIGDVLTFGKEEGQIDPKTGGKTGLAGIIAVQKAFEKEAIRISPWIEVVDEERRQGGISRLVGLGDPINLAARLESVSKAFPDHTAFIRESQWLQLPMELQMEYDMLEEVQLKGVSDVEVLYGLPRYQEAA